MPEMNEKLTRKEIREEKRSALASEVSKLGYEVLKVTKRGVKTPLGVVKSVTYRESDSCGDLYTIRYA